MKASMYTHKREYLLSRYDLNASESWLEEMSRKGWQAQRLLESGKVEFAWVEPAQKSPRYRLQPFSGPVQELSTEEYEVYSALGWSYLGGVKGLRLWRCDDPAAPELDTDPVMQAEGCQQLIRQMFWRQLFPSALLFLLLLAVLYRTFLTPGFPLLNLLYTTRFAYFPLMVLLLGICGLHSFWELHNLRQLAQRLRNGISQHRSPTAWKTMRTLRRIGGILWLLWLLFSPSSSPHVSHPTPEAAEIEALVELSTLEGREPTAVDLCSVKTKHHELAPRMWFINQDSGTSRLESAYFHLLSLPLAQRTASELSEAFSRRYSGQITLTPQEREGLDAFFYGAANIEGRQVQLVVAQLGRNVLGLCYWGTEDLENHLPEIIEALGEQP